MPDRTDHDFFRKEPPPPRAHGRRARKERRRSVAEANLSLLGAGPSTTNAGLSPSVAAQPIASELDPDPKGPSHDPGPPSTPDEGAVEALVLPASLMAVSPPLRRTRPTEKVVPPRKRVLRASSRFSDAFDAATPGLQRLAIQEVRTLQRRLASNPATGFQTYQTVRNLPSSRVRELELGGGPRLLAHYQDGQVTLLAIGAHEVTSEYKAAMLRKDLADARPADSLFEAKAAVKLTSIFGSNPDRRRAVYGTELSPEWIYFLAPAQNAFVRACVQSYKRASINHPAFHFAVGGPGTGKTSVLLKLFVELRKLGAKPCLLVSDPVADYIERSSGVKLGKARISHRDWEANSADLSTFDALLFDDPSSAESIHAAMADATGEVRLAVVGFDPFQLTTDMSDEDYQALINRCQADVRELRVCYRQKEAVGRAAHRVMDTIARATPYLAEDKVERHHADHASLSDLVNDASYPNPYGYEQTYMPGTMANVRYEAGRMRSEPLWAYSPPLLLVVDEASPAGDWNWRRLLTGIDHQRVAIHWTQSWGARVWWTLAEVKGLEFQHVVMVLSLPAFAEMDLGFAGSGVGNYLARRLARIPFSRAKDSLVTLCVGPTELVKRYRAARTLLHANVGEYGIVETYKAPLLREIVALGGRGSP